MKSIYESTKEERLNIINKVFKCRHDCESCGVCTVFKGIPPEVALKDYIDGIAEFNDVYNKR